MLPMKALRLQIGELLAADTTTLAPVSANKIALLAADFSSNEDLTVADLTLADFDGSTPIAGASGTQLAGIDPLTGEQLVTIKEPAGGWRWEMSGLTVPVQTIFGYALLDSTLADLQAIQKLPAPITLDTVGQQIDIGAAVLRIVLQPVS